MAFLVRVFITLAIVLIVSGGFALIIERWGLIPNTPVSISLFVSGVMMVILFAASALLWVVWVGSRE